MAKKVIKPMISHDYRRIKAIRRYLKNQMSTLEKARFEKKIQIDEELRDEVGLYRLVIEELKQGS